MNKITNYNETLKSLADWIKGLKEAAKDDTSFSIAWFHPTIDYPFSIVGGWTPGFGPEYADTFCISKSNPEYAIAVKIVINNGPYTYTDFEIMDMPYEPETGEVDDTEIVLEWDDDPEYAAQFFLGEWERIMKEHKEGGNNE